MNDALTAVSEGFSLVKAQGPIKFCKILLGDIEPRKLDRKGKNCL